MNEFFLLLAWLIYFFLHSLLAATAVKQFFYQVFATTPRLYRIGYNLFTLTGLIILCWFQFVITSAVLFHTVLITNAISFFIMIIGLFIMVASIRNYDWKSFIGITEEKIYALVIKGMNKYVRHPLYTGTMLFVLGFFIWQPYYKNLLLMLLMWLYLAVGIIFEERKLVTIYGEIYKNYQKKVKKMIPFIW